MLAIDGTLGEGGGQILRTSLALSLVTGEPFRIVRIRGGRRLPGLLAQHLTAVRAAAEAEEYLAAGVPVGRHLTDQLLLPLAIAAGGGAFRTLPPTRHTETNARVIERFLGPTVEMAEEREGRWRVTMGK